MVKDFIANIRGKIFILKCRYLNKNVRIGKGLKIFQRLVISGSGRIIIGENCHIYGIKGDKCQYVTIDTHSKNGAIIIGNNATICAARISATYKIDIGDNFLIEESGITDTDYHSIDRDRGKPIHEDLEKCQIHIGNNVAIGARCIITKGVSIENNVVIVPGSIVAKNIKAGSLVMGNPAKEIKMDNSN